MTPVEYLTVVCNNLKTVKVLKSTNNNRLLLRLEKIALCFTAVKIEKHFIYTVPFTIKIYGCFL